MKTIKNYSVHAYIHTLSPLHIASPEEAWLNTDTMKIAWKKEGNGAYTPCTAVQKLIVPDCDGNFHRLPVIPANNIMGRIRRHAAATVIDVLSQKGETISIKTFSGLTCGAVTGNPDGADVTFEEYRETRAHPYLGLLGGGPRMMRRHVRMFNAVPYTDITEFMFKRVRHPMLDDRIHKTSLDCNRLFQCWTFKRKDDLRDLANIDLASKSIEDFENEIIKRQTLIISDKKSGASEGSADVKKSRHSTQTWSSFEFVIPGLAFPLSFELSVNSEQLALFLIALDKFASTERLGGMVRNGLGHFSLEDVVVTDDRNNVLATGLFNNSALVRDHEFVEPLMAKWASACSGINAQDLERFFSLSEPQKTKA